MVVYALGIPLLMVAAVIDASVLSHVRYLNGQPSLLLIIIVSWALLNAYPESMPWAVIGGIFADLLSVAPLGASSVGFVLVVWGVSSIFGRVGRRNLLFPPLAAVIATLIYSSVLAALLIVSGWSIPLGDAGLRWVLPSVAFNFLGIIFVFRIMGILVEFFRPPSIPTY